MTYLIRNKLYLYLTLAWGSRGYVLERTTLKGEGIAIRFKMVFIRVESNKTIN
jgi:hypothetical protein